jgi:hypothetical protein
MWMFLCTYNLLSSFERCDYSDNTLVSTRSITLLALSNVQTMNDIRFISSLQKRAHTSTSICLTIIHCTYDTNSREDFLLATFRDIQYNDRYDLVRSTWSVRHPKFLFVSNIFLYLSMSISRVTCDKLFNVNLCQLFYIYQW